MREGLLYSIYAAMALKLDFMLAFVSSSQGLGLNKGTLPAPGQALVPINQRQADSAKIGTFKLHFSMRTRDAAIAVTDQPITAGITISHSLMWLLRL